MQVLFIFVSFSKNVKTSSICKASSRVGVRMRHSGFSGILIFSESEIKSETMGAAKDKVLPEPV